MNVQTPPSGGEREGEEPLRAVEKLQRRAADPKASVWVSANAGSGKTRVLVDRVARLLLAGAPPQKILCLTYTRAAAAEMQDRLFKTLGRWALASEADLRRTLVDLGEAQADLAKARRLFARALETPGGLRLQTIHGFCESVLRRFPVETGISPRFALMAEEENKALRLEAAQKALLSLRDSADPADRAAAARFFIEAPLSASGAFGRRGSLEDLAAAAFAHRGAFLREEEEGLAPGGRARAALGAEPGATEEGLWGDFARGLDFALLEEIADHLLTCKAAKKTDLETGAGLKAALALNGLAQRTAFRSVLFTQKGELRKSLTTKAVAEAREDLAQALAEFAAALHAADSGFAALSAAARAEDFARFARLLIRDYDAARRPRGLLDFDDLIQIAARLFREESRGWAMLKLDEGVDHILVDEAQDTSPAQWTVPISLAEEFFDGEGARQEGRTLFVVGDEKQSIYSFQGADHAVFATQRAWFRERGVGAGDSLSLLDLTHSFRSSPVILAAVDAVFRPPEARKGLTADPGSAVSHKAAFPKLPGRVEWWPAVVKDEEAGPLEWIDLTPASGAEDPRARLADRLAERLELWIKSRAPLAPGGRAIRPGDVLVLARNRDGFFRRLISALKERGLPVAGEDRLGLRASLAVRDLLATARAALLPADSLSLAAALRSPLFGFSEDDLIALTEPEPGSFERPTLWAALTRRREERPHWETAQKAMGDLMARVDYLRPYEFFEKILIEQQGRRRLLKRLGPPAAEPIDELLAQALEYETGRPPSLQGFVRWAEALETEIKREQAQGADEIRVMTIHGAKGLEAELVVVADSGEPPDDRRESALLAVGGAEQAGVLWLGKKGAEAAAEAAEQARAARLARIAEEHRRLLYVALTRARTRLILCGWRGKKAAKGEAPGLGAEGSWHHAVWRGLSEAGAAPLAMEPAEVWGAAEGLLIQSEPPAAQTAESPAAKPLAQTPKAPPPEDWAPDWAAGALAPDPAPPLPVAPSRLAIEAADPSPPESDPAAPESKPAFPEGGLSRAAAMARGVAWHRILERLAEGEPLDPGESEDVASRALALVADPAFAEIFQPGPEARILSEAPIFGPLAALNGRSVSGSIDRLIVTPERLLIVDFKTGKPPEKLPVGYLRQMAVYAAAVGEIFGPLHPGRPVETALLWLDADPPRLDRLPAPRLQAALADLRARLERPRPEVEADPGAEIPDEPPISEPEEAEEEIAES